MAKNLLSDHIRKIQDIKQACREHDVDRLIELASTTGGLVLDELRQQACEICKRDLPAAH